MPSNLKMDPYYVVARFPPKWNDVIPSLEIRVIHLLHLAHLIVHLLQTSYCLNHDLITKSKLNALLAFIIIVGINFPSCTGLFFALPLEFIAISEFGLVMFTSLMFTFPSVYTLSVATSNAIAARLADFGEIMASYESSLNAIPVHMVLCQIAICIILVLPYDKYVIQRSDKDVDKVISSIKPVVQQEIIRRRTCVDREGRESGMDEFMEVIKELISGGFHSIGLCDEVKPTGEKRILTAQPQVTTTTAMSLIESEDNTAANSPSATQNSFKNTKTQTGTPSTIKNDEETDTTAAQNSSPTSFPDIAQKKTPSPSETRPQVTTSSGRLTIKETGTQSANEVSTIQ